MEKPEYEEKMKRSLCVSQVLPYQLDFFRCKEKLYMIQRKISSKMRNPRYKYILINTDLISSLLVWSLGGQNCLQQSYFKYFKSNIKQPQTQQLLIRTLTQNKTIETSQITTLLINKAKLSKKCLQHWQISRMLCHWIGSNQLPKQYKRVCFMLQQYAPKEQHIIDEVRKQKEKLLEQNQLKEDDAKFQTTLIFKLLEQENMSLLCLVDSQYWYDQNQLYELLEQDLDLAKHQLIDEDSQIDEFQIRNDPHNSNKKSINDSLLISPPKRLHFDQSDRQSPMTRKIEPQFIKQKQQMSTSQHELNHLSLRLQQIIQQKDRLINQIKKQQDEIIIWEKSLQQKKLDKQRIQNQFNNISNGDIQRLNKQLNNQRKTLDNLNNQKQQLQKNILHLKENIIKKLKDQLTNLGQEQQLIKNQIETRKQQRSKLTKQLKTLKDSIDKIKDQRQKIQKDKRQIQLSYQELQKNVQQLQNKKQMALNLIQKYNLQKIQESNKLQSLQKDLQQIRSKQQHTTNERNKLELQKNQEQEILRVLLQEQEQRKDKIAQLSQQRDQQVEHISMLKLQQKLWKDEVQRFTSEKDASKKDIKQLIKTLQQNQQQKRQISAKINLILCQTQTLKDDQNHSWYVNLIVWLCIFVFGFYRVYHFHESSYLTQKHDFQIDKNIVKDLSETSFDPITKKQLFKKYKSCLSTHSQSYCQQIIQIKLLKFDQNAINIEKSLSSSSSQHLRSPNKDIKLKTESFTSKNQEEKKNIKKEASRQSHQNYNQDNLGHLKTD